MLLLAAAALTASASSLAPAGGYTASARGRAVIRIVAAARLSFDGPPKQDGIPAQRSVTIRLDGLERQAKLIEFQ